MKHLQALLSLSVSSFCDLLCGLTFYNMPLKCNMLVHHLLDWNRFLKFRVFSLCIPGALEEILSLCHNLASCVLLRNNWVVTNRWQQQHCETEELVKNGLKRPTSTSNVMEGSGEKGSWGQCFPILSSRQRRGPSSRLLLVEPLLLLPVQGQILLGLWASPATYCRVHLCLFSAAPCCVCFQLILLVQIKAQGFVFFLETLLRNYPAENVGCGFWFCFKENITDWLFVFAFK